MFRSTVIMHQNKVTCLFGQVPVGKGMCCVSMNRSGQETTIKREKDGRARADKVTERGRRKKMERREISER